MGSGPEKNKTLKQNRFFRARMTFYQSLMVTDSALKLDYSSVIFLDPGLQIDKT